MTDEDIRRMVREFRAAVATELEAVHSRIDGLVARIDGMEAGIMNELRSLGRRVGRLEDR